MTDDDLGTVRWFGTSWGAPVCDPRTHVTLTIRRHCVMCGESIRALDRGVTIPRGDQPGERSYYHLACWMETILGPDWQARYPTVKIEPPGES